MKSVKSREARCAYGLAYALAFVFLGLYAIGEIAGIVGTDSRRAVVLTIAGAFAAACGLVQVARGARDARFARGAVDRPDPLVQSSSEPSPSFGIAMSFVAAVAIGWLVGSVTLGTVVGALAAGYYWLIFSIIARRHRRVNR